MAKFVNLSCDIVDRKYVLSLLSELKDLSLLQDVAGMTWNVSIAFASSGIIESVSFSTSSLKISGTEYPLEM